MSSIPSTGCPACCAWFAAAKENTPLIVHIMVYDLVASMIGDHVPLWYTAMYME